MLLPAPNLPLESLSPWQTARRYEVCIDKSLQSNNSMGDLLLESSWQASAYDLWAR